MGRIVKRITCPGHSPDLNPSCVVYEDGWMHCFSCGYHRKGAQSVIDAPEEGPAYVEDIGSRLEYIESLPRSLIRGHLLPSDTDGFYLVYPGQPFYKQRLWDCARSKYRSPIGHSKPLFVAKTGEEPLIVVEGEMNALSLAEVTDCGVVSPGAATDFASPKYLSQLLGYCRIVIVVDCDKAGGIAAIQLATILKKHGKTFRIVLAKKDFNGVLCDEGKEGLREYAASLGVPTRLSERQDDLSPPGRTGEQGDDYPSEY